MYKKKVVDGVTHPEPEPMRVIAGVQGPYNAADVETINGVDTVLAKAATTKEPGTETMILTPFVDIPGGEVTVVGINYVGGAVEGERVLDPQATMNVGVLGVLDILECMCDAMYAMTEDTTTWLPIQREIMRIKKLVHG